MRRRHPTRSCTAVTAVLAYSYLLYALGPILAYARHDLHLTYLQVSSHTALWAAGTIATGATHLRLVRRFGRWRVARLSAALAAVGAAALASAAAPAITLAGAALAGAAGTQLQAASFSELAENDARGASGLLPTSLAAAAGLAVAVPFVLIAAQASIGWRAAALVPVPVLALIVWAARPAGSPRPRPSPWAPARRGWERPGRRGADIPALEACLAGLAVALEFAVVFLGPQLLYGGQGLSLRATVDALAWLYAGQLIARAAGRRYLGRIAPRRLFFLSLALAAAGFSSLWLGPGSTWVRLGLAVMGLGVGNLYPTALALALRESKLADEATGAVQFSAGIAVVLSQLAVGGLAEAFGIVHAFAVEPVLMAAAALLAARARQSTS